MSLLLGENLVNLGGRDGEGARDAAELFGGYEGWVGDVADVDGGRCGGACWAEEAGDVLWVRMSAGASKAVEWTEL